MRLTYKVKVLRDRWEWQIPELEDRLEEARNEVNETNGIMYERKKKLIDHLSQFESLSSDATERIISDLGFEDSFEVGVNVHNQKSINQLKPPIKSELVYHDDGSVWDADTKVCGYRIRRLSACIFNESEIQQAISLAKEVINSLAEYVDFDGDEIDCLKRAGFEL